MTSVAHRLADIEVLDLDGRAISVGTAWSERPALLVFIRHFG